MSWKIPSEHRGPVGEATGACIGGLGPRLSAVAAAVPMGSVAADIGADHGHLSLGLLDSGRASFVYAVDASEPALAGARQVLAPEVARGRAAVEHGDGFDALPHDRVECAVLAGIGSRTALDIVRRGLAAGKRPARIVFQPSAGEHDVRTEMLELGYGITDEALVAEGQRLFMVLSFDDGVGVTSLDDLVDVYVGPLLRSTGGPALDAWLQVQFNWIADIIARTEDPAEREPWRQRLSAIEALQTSAPPKKLNLRES